jgi:hypothetical protein
MGSQLYQIVEDVAFRDQPKCSTEAFWSSEAFQTVSIGEWKALEVSAEVGQPAMRLRG